MAHLRLCDVRQIAQDAAMIRMDNRGGESPYDELLLCFNASPEAVRVPLEGKWAVLADGEDSSLHLKPKTAEEERWMEPVSALILGRLRGD